MAKKPAKKQNPANAQKKEGPGAKPANMPLPEPEIYYPLDASYTEIIKIYFQKFFFREFIWLVLYFFLLLPFSLVHTFSSERSPLGNLEQSWQFAINMAIGRHFTFGRDFIFTYGPLGFLQTKYIIGISKWLILLPEMFLVACSIFALRYILQRSGRSILCAISIAVALILMKWINMLDLFVPLFLFYLFYFFHHRRLWALLLATVLVVFVFFVKVNWGIVVLFFLFSALVISVYQKLLSIREAGLVTAVYIALAILLAFVLRVDLILYIQSSMHLISGYNEAQFIPIPFTDMHFILAVPVLGLFAAGFIAGFKHYTGNFLFLCLWVFSGMWLFIIFKYGFVRTDWHIDTFFMTCSTPFGLMYAFETGRFKKTWAYFSIAALAISCCALTLTKYSSNILNRPVINYLSPEYIRDIFTDVSYKKDMPADRATPFIIPDDYLKYIGQSTVDIIPTEISEIYYHKLNYDPRPIVQSYSAYDLFLDTKNYEKYTSASRPEYVLFSLATIDARYAFWDESITKTGLLTDYELVTKTKGSTPQDSAMLLFKSRSKPLKLDILGEKEVTLQMGQEYSIAHDDNLQYLFAHVEYSLWGKVLNFFYQPPQLVVGLRHADGQMVFFAGIVPILKTGVLMNRKVDNCDEARALFSGRLDRSSDITGIIFYPAPGLNPEIKATIREVKYPLSGQ